MLKSNKFYHFDLKQKFLIVLGMIYFTLNLVGIPMAYKIISLGLFSGPGGLVVLPLIFLTEDVMVELYGFYVAKFMLFNLIISSVIFTVLCLFITHLPSPDFWHLQSEYDVVFDPLMVSVPSAVVSIFLGRYSNIYLMSRWKIMTNGRHFFIRSILSTFICSSLSLAIFFMLSFSGRVQFSVLIKLFASDLFLRIFYTIIGGGPVSLLVLFLKKKLGVDVFDYSVNYNPFAKSVI